MIERGHHDMGGLPAGRVERTEHDYADWERRVDAMAVLLNSRITVDERRRSIESLAPEQYRPPGSLSANICMPMPN